MAQVAEADRLTFEEFSFGMETGLYGNTRIRQSISDSACIRLRELAQSKDPVKGVRDRVTPVEVRDGIRRESRLKKISTVLLNKIQAGGVRVFQNHKVTSIVRKHRSKRRDVLKVTFVDGKTLFAIKMFLNVGRRDLQSFGLESEPVKSSNLGFKNCCRESSRFGAYQNVLLLERCLVDEQAQAKARTFSSARGTFLPEVP